MAIDFRLYDIKTLDKNSNHLFDHNSDNRLRDSTWVIEEDDSRFERHLERPCERKGVQHIWIISLIFGILNFELPL